MRHLLFTAFLALAGATQAQSNDARKELLYPVNPPRKVNPDARPALIIPGPGIPPPTPTPAMAPKRGVLKIENVQILDEPGKSKTITIRLSRQKGEDVDPEQVKVIAHFFEKAATGVVEVTTARVESIWQTPPIDWNQSDPEELALKIPLPAKDSGRSYHGCRVEVFYKNILRDNWRSSTDVP